MSKIERAIRSTIEYFMNNKEPIYCDAYKWGSYEEQHATRWLGKKKFIRYKREGDYYKMWRSKLFYEIYDEIKELSPEKIRKYLIEKTKKGE